METKTAFTSKTLWFNFIMAGLAFFPQIYALAQQNMEVTLGVFALGNILLRFFTTKKITLLP